MKLAFLILFCIAMGLLLTFLPGVKERDTKALLAAKYQDCMPYYAVVERDGGIACRAMMIRSFAAESPLPAKERR